VNNNCSRCFFRGLFFSDRRALSKTVVHFMAPHLSESCRHRAMIYQHLYVIIYRRGPRQSVRQRRRRDVSTRSGFRTRTTQISLFAYHSQCPIDYFLDVLFSDRAHKPNDTPYTYVSSSSSSSSSSCQRYLFRASHGEQHVITYRTDNGL